MSAPILWHFDPALKIRIETDASGFAVAAILSQLFREHEHARWHPIAFFSKKLSDTESRYKTHDSELLAIILAFRTWRHYLAYTRSTMVVKTDHNSLKYFMTKRKLNNRQARWAKELTAFDFVFEYQAGSRNPADGPSRRPDLAIGVVGSEGTSLPSLHKKFRLVGVVGSEENSLPLLHEEFGIVGVVGSGETLLPLLHAGGEVISLPTWHKKFQTILSAPLVVAAFGRHEVPAMPQFKAQERGGRHSPTSLSLGSKGDTPDHYSDGAVGVIPLLEPVAGTAGCKQYVPRAVAICAIGSKIVYLESGETLIELLSSLQRLDPYVQRRKHEGLLKPTKAGVIGEWSFDADGLLRRGVAVFVPNDSAIRSELLMANHNDPMGGHFGVAKTLEILWRKYFW
jgi:hypothetical protein